MFKERSRCFLLTFFIIACPFSLLHKALVVSHDDAVIKYVTNADCTVYKITTSKY
jgi:hypothetical protein